MSRSDPLRSATVSDLPWIVALLEGSGLPTAGVADHLSDFLVAELESNPTGCGALERYGEEALLRSVAVSEGSRGTGIGRAIVASLVETARKEGIREVILLTTTAASYFPKFGFRAIDPSLIPESVRESEELRVACPASPAGLWLLL